MKALILILIPFLSFGQCKPSRSFSEIPSFLSLFFGGDCLQGNFTNQSICARFGGSQSGRLAYFAASSPTGVIGSITASPDELFPSPDSLDVVYNFSGSNVDIFCPYAFIVNPLAVDFCGVNAKANGNEIAVQWATCSNHNTSHFNVVISGDLNSWNTARRIAPLQVNNSNLSIYQTKFPYKKGLWYIRIIEVDMNGDKTLSDVVKVSVESEYKINTFDLLGRETNKEQFQWLSK
jgi:hypothetical protein